MQLFYRIQLFLPKRQFLRLARRLAQQKSSTPYYTDRDML